MSSGESNDGSDFDFDFNSRIIDDDALNKLVSTDKSDWKDHIPRNENSPDANKMVESEDAGEMSDDSTETVDFSFEMFQAKAKKIITDKPRAGKYKTFSSHSLPVSILNVTK